MFDTLKRTAVAAVAALAIAGCDGSSSNSDSCQNDLLNCAGNFDSADTQAQWYLQAPEGATLNEDLWYQGSECPTGTCAKINSSSYGVETYGTQLIFWDLAADPAAAKTVTLRGDRQYVVRLWGRAVNPAGGSATYPVQFWLQKADEGSVILPSVSSVELGADGVFWESDPFTYGSSDTDTGEFTVKINLGPDDWNAGTTFYLDRLQVIESPMPPPPTGTDVFVGAGSFSDEDAQSMWTINGTNDVALTFPADCGAGFTGPCARLEGNDFGTDPWSTQLMFGGFNYVQLEDGKTYQIRLSGKVDNASGPVSLSVWVQHLNLDAGTGDVPVNGNYGSTAVSFALTSTQTMVIQESFTVSSPNPEGHNFVINLGGSTAGAVFWLDDIQLVELE